jgi:hypothetical protein
VELLGPAGQVLDRFEGSKQEVGRRIFQVIQQRLIDGRLAKPEELS